MNEKRVLKKELKDCKKQIKHSNRVVRGFMKSNYYQSGSYQKLQTTTIWKKAKYHLLRYHKLKYPQLVCFKCRQRIINSPVLHHRKYNWKKLFSPRYVRFVHQKCHDVVHSGKRGYKKRMSYHQVKFLTIIICIVVVLIVLSLGSLFRG